MLKSHFVLCTDTSHSRTSKTNKTNTTSTHMIPLLKKKKFAHFSSSHVYLSVCCGDVRLWDSVCMLVGFVHGVVCCICRIFMVCDVCMYGA